MTDTPKIIAARIEVARTRAALLETTREVQARLQPKTLASEAWETLYWMGIDAELIQDVGVAGPQRLLPHLPRLRRCDVVIAIAGFEGALPSVIGGHLDCPVFAVPTSNSFSVGLPGLPPLLAMLNSCAPNVAVVNVDGGFKAGYLAGLFIRKIHRAAADASLADNGQAR